MSSGLISELVLWFEFTDDPFGGCSAHVNFHLFIILSRDTALPCSNHGAMLTGDSVVSTLGLTDSQ